LLNFKNQNKFSSNCWKKYREVAGGTPAQEKIQELFD
jgi:hypothetical protein